MFLRFVFFSFEDFLALVREIPEGSTGTVASCASGGA